MSRPPGAAPPKWPVGTPTARYALCLPDTPTPKSVQTKILIMAQKYYIKIFIMVSQTEAELQEQLINEHLKKLDSAEKSFIPFVIPYVVCTKILATRYSTPRRGASYPQPLYMVYGPRSGPQDVVCPRRGCDDMSHWHRSSKKTPPEGGATLCSID